MENNLNYVDVYVVVCEYVTNDGDGMDVRVFSDEEKARMFLKKDFEKVLKSHQKDGYHYHYEGDIAVIHEEGCYNEMHLSWSIKKCEVE